MESRQFNSCDQLKSFSKTKTCLKWPHLQLVANQKEKTNWERNEDISCSKQKVSPRQSYNEASSYQPPI